jgi:hypothetical protein
MGILLPLKILLFVKNLIVTYKLYVNLLKSQIWLYNKFNFINYCKIIQY